MNIHYTHPTGLVFETSRMMDDAETTSYDITLVCLFMPNSASDPMIIIDWYCGAPTIEATKEIADKFCATKTWLEIQNLLECQDIAESCYPEHARLNSLLKAMHNQMEQDLKNDTCSNFSITVNGNTIEFALGGPQFEGLMAFINHIAAENWHNVDMETLTVTGTL